MSSFAHYAIAAKEHTKLRLSGFMRRATNGSVSLVAMAVTFLTLYGSLMARIAYLSKQRASARRWESILMDTKTKLEANQRSKQA